MSGHIVAMGGGGFSSLGADSVIDDFILSLSRRQPARVCFLPTASSDSAEYVVNFYRAFSRRCLPTDVTVADSTLSRRPPLTADIERVLEAQDVIYVGGGNTANLLAMWRAHGIDRILHRLWSNGTVLAGVSAGMLCWFRGGVTDSYGGLELLNDGLGFIDATACPHYDSEPGRRPTYHRLVAQGALPGYAADDGAALHFVGPAFVEGLTVHEGAGVYHVERAVDKVVETRLTVRVLR